MLWQREFQRNFRSSASLYDVPENVGQIIPGGFSILDFKPLNHQNGSKVGRRILEGEREPPSPE